MQPWFLEVLRHAGNVLIAVPLILVSQWLATLWLKPYIERLEREYQEGMARRRANLALNDPSDIWHRRKQP